MADTPTADQNRFNKLQQFLKPAWLAGALSLGFHGVLFAAGPTFPNLGFDQLTEAEAATERRNVPLVELTAAEQERLPDFSSTFYDFDAFSDLEPLPPLFGDSAGASNGGGDRPLNSQPLLSPSNRSTPPSASRLPFGITRLESGSRSPFPLSSSGLPPLQQNSGATLPAPDTPRDPAATVPDEESPGADALKPADGDLEISAEEAAAIAANSNPSDTLSLEERLQAYAFDSANTDPEAIASRYDQWLEAGQTLATDLEIGEPDAIQTAFEAAAAAGILSAPDEAAPEGDAEISESSIVRRPVELALDYGAGICLTKAPQKGLIGAWVGPEGNLLGTPEVIRSTGYLGLNQQAIQYIETLDFSAVETFTGYQFEVSVNYDANNCVDIGRSTPAAPTDAASEADDRSGAANSKAPDKAPSERLRSTEREALSPARSPEAEPEVPGQASGSENATVDSPLRPSEASPANVDRSDAQAPEAMDSER